MKKLLLVIMAIALSGCTTYSHMEQSSNEDEYFLVKNTRLLFIISIPTIDKCSVLEDEKLKCLSAR